MSKNNKSNKRKPQNYNKFDGNKPNYQGMRNKRDETYPTKDNSADRRAGTTNEGSFCELSSMRGRENDPSWYNRLNVLLNDAAKISFNTQLGTAYHGYDGLSDAPGVLALYYACIPGKAVTANDGVNIAASALFQYIRKDLSTVASYAAADVMMYVLGLDQICSMYTFIARNFGIINAYSSLNLYYPRAILRACGMLDEDIDNFISHINDYRARFNNLISKAGSLYLPTDFTITSRHAWMFANLFKDHDDPKAQTILHVPAMFYQINETYSDQGTALTPVLTINDPHDMDALLTTFDMMIEKYRNSDSMLKIAADMKRAFADKPSWIFNTIPENYATPWVYSEEVLSQIENTTILPYPKDLDSWRDTPSGVAGSWAILQSVNKNTISFDPSWTPSDLKRGGLDVSPAYTEDNPKLINMHWRDPSSDDIAVATRNMVFLGKGSTNYFLTSAGSDICLGAIMYYLDAKNADDSISMESLSHVQIMNSSEWNPTTLNAWSANDWAPTFYLMEKHEPSQTIANLRYGNWICEFDNYTYIDRAFLDRLNNNIICSMWSIPNMGIFVQ